MRSPIRAAVALALAAGVVAVAPATAQKPEPAAHAAGGDVVAITQAIDGLKSDATDLTTGGRRLLTDAQTQILRTMGFINTTWPPLPPGDG
jgi:hypothetical protein